MLERSIAPAWRLYSRHTGKPHVPVRTGSDPPDWRLRWESRIESARARGHSEISLYCVSHRFPSGPAARPPMAPPGTHE